ncbi:fimbria/pilus periplasmic chaperone [Andreprevotia chitinilytica]|uniref:fimbria/pilus periplasmic chaperone n=1 Tax=Andreprevotia chitinilytica TaxID=396808 RepID=UPI001B80504F|nr:fimbria/pilus periplasmic chaperone [Andreprevotia chitinilytica]
MVAVCLAVPVQASIVIAGTRVIYPESAREVSVKLENNGEYPALVQAWVDKGDPSSRPNDIEVPFVLTPPIFRVDPGKGQTLRVMFTREPLPGDKESVFWLNVLEIPPKAEAKEGANLLQMAFRTRIKIFFRPKGLDSEGSGKAPGQIVWSSVPAPDGKGFAVQATNPTPYNVSIASVSITDGEKSHETHDSAMVTPGASHVFVIDGLANKSPSASAELGFTVINDYGGPSGGKALLSPAPREPNTVSPSR